MKHPGRVGQRSGEQQRGEARQGAVVGGSPCKECHVLQQTKHIESTNTESIRIQPQGHFTQGTETQRPAHGQPSVRFTPLTHTHTHPRPQRPLQPCQQNDQDPTLPSSQPTFAHRDGLRWIGPHRLSTHEPVLANHHLATAKSAGLH